MARNTYYSFSWDDNGATFDFSDGTSIDVDWGKLDDETKLRLMAHGLKQKVIDAGAIPRDTETGRSATNAEKIQASMLVAGRINRNEWTAPREGGAGPKGGLLLAALCRLQPSKSREELAAWLKAKSKSEQAALRTSPKIAPIIDEIRAESSRGVDVSDMLDDLGI